MYMGKGSEGLCGLAAGLVAAYNHFPTQKNDFGRLLGPVVGQYENIVIKAYDDAKRRKANVDLVRKYVDRTAILFKSPSSINGRNLELLQMKYYEGSWKTTSSTAVFLEILKQLKLLHDDNTVHGDIRLANMLPTGCLIDFDYAGEEGPTKYPRGFQLIHTDGKRHEEVVAMFDPNDDDAIACLNIGKHHDCFSMAFVMRLFEPDGTSNKACWTDVAERVKMSDLPTAIGVLSVNAFEVEMISPHRSREIDRAALSNMTRPTYMNNLE
jgi:serine/threonine protein kinase